MVEVLILGKACRHPPADGRVRDRALELIGRDSDLDRPLRDRVLERRGVGPIDRKRLAIIKGLPLDNKAGRLSSCRAHR